MPRVSAGSSNRPQWPFVLYYDTGVVAVASPGQVQLPVNVNGVSVHNTGNTIVLCNEDPLQPGESKTIGGNWGEIFTGRIFIRFILPTPAPAVPVNQATVTSKFYVPEPLGNTEDLNPILGIK